MVRKPDPEPRNRRYQNSRKPRTCPACGKATVARIVYGYPDYGALEKMGDYVLGGCDTCEDDPAWECTNCGAQIQRARRA